MPRSERRDGFLGDSYIEHRDDSGTKTGESREKTGFFGDEYTEHRDADGNKVGESQETTGFLGNEYTVNRNADGNKTGESREQTDFFGEKYTEHRDTSGKKIGESRTKTGWFGNQYVEHTQDDSGDLTDGLVKLAFFLIVVGIVIWLVVMAVTITLMLAPIWLGGVAVGAITGFLVGNSTANRIAAGALAQVPIFEELEGKRTRIRIAGEYLRQTFGLGHPYLWLIGATAAYGAALAGWPIFARPDTFTQVLLGAGMLAGIILGTLAGRRVGYWQLENRIFARANSTKPTPLVAPNFALGFSIPGVLGLAGIWIFSLVQTAGTWDAAQSLGLKHDRRVPTRTATATTTTTTDPVVTVPPPLPASLGPATPTVGLPDGYFVPEDSLSPDKRYGVMVPDHAHFEEGGRGQNKVIEMATGKTIAEIDAESWFQDRAVRMNHGSVAARWSRNGNVLAWIVGGKWAPRSFNLLKIGNGSTEWQCDVLKEVQQQILQETKNAEPTAYEAARLENQGSGSAYPDGFVIDVTLPSAGFELPMTCTVTLDSNPKQIDRLTSLRSALDVSVDTDGHLQFTSLRLLSAQPKSEPEESAVRAFIVARLAVELSHDLNRILPNYADRVAYWDNGTVNGDFIRKDKAAYFERWPVAKEEIEGPVEVSRKGGDWVAKFKTRFRVENAARGAAIQGVQEGTYTLRFSDYAFHIVGENGHVVEKQTLEIPKSGNPLAPVQPGHYPGEKFPQTRTVALNLQDLQRWSKDDLRYAINEMFARHGADFPKEETRRQFAKFSWYQRRPGLGFDDVETRFFSDLERENLKRLAAARDPAAARNAVPAASGAAAPTAPASDGSGRAPLRPGPHARLVTTRDLKKMAGQKINDTWFAGDFVAANITGNTIVMYPIWGGGFVRGYSTEIQATFRNGVPPFDGRDRLPMDPMTSTAGLRVDQAHPLRIISITRSAKGGGSDGVVVVRAEQ